MYVKYINLRRCREEDHLNYDWSSNNYHLNCFLEISSGRPIRLSLWSTGHINQSPNVFLPSISGFIFLPSVRSSHYSQITSGRNSTRVPLKSSGILTVFSLHDQFYFIPSAAGKITIIQAPLKSLARNDGHLNSQRKFMQQIYPGCPLWIA